MNSVLIQNGFHSSLRRISYKFVMSGVHLVVAMQGDDIITLPVVAVSRDDTVNTHSHQHIHRLRIVSTKEVGYVGSHMEGSLYFILNYHRGCFCYLH